jgi:hypothetical protein
MQKDGVIKNMQFIILIRNEYLGYTIRNS